MIYTYSRAGVTPSEADQLTYADGLTIHNSDSSGKQIFAGGIIVSSDTEKVFGVAKLLLGKNDSLRISSPNRHDIDLLNYGGQTTYTLQLRSASSNGEIAFEHANIPLEGNSLHIIEPGWDSLGGQRVTILMDQGNDGTIDDSMLVDNQTTGLADGPTTGIPSNFALHQNYPNPFNPITRISYSLPVGAHVLLHVYNVVGAAVATVIDEQQSAGYKSVAFDATRLPSGVYFYRLQAGKFTETKKMIIVR
jgi:hypothetical protein